MSVAAAELLPLFHCIRMRRQVSYIVSMHQGRQHFEGRWLEKVPQLSFDFALNNVRGNGKSNKTTLNNLTAEFEKNEFFVIYYSKNKSTSRT